MHTSLAICMIPQTVLLYQTGIPTLMEPTMPQGMALYLRGLEPHHCLLNQWSHTCLIPIEDLSVLRIITDLKCHLHHLSIPRVTVKAMRVEVLRTTITTVTATMIMDEIETETGIGTEIVTVTMVEGEMIIVVATGRETGTVIEVAESESESGTMTDIETEDVIMTVIATANANVAVTGVMMTTTIFTVIVAAIAKERGTILTFADAIENETMTATLIESEIENAIGNERRNETGTRIASRIENVSASVIATL